MGKNYVYRPEKGGGNFAGYLEILRQCYDVVGEGVNHVSPEVIADVHSGFEKCGVRVSELYVDTGEYEGYKGKARYAELYPDYYMSFLAEKSFEHFIALKLLQIGGEEVFIDLASENSPAPEIYSRLTGCKSYSQDIMYPPGIDGNRIGGDACSMPVADGFADKAALTCSLEHFEGDGDYRLFLEMSRVLRTAGAVCIVPLYMFTESAIQTDPAVSVPNHVEFDSGAKIFCAKGWGNRFARFYSPESFTERIFSRTKDLFDFEVFRIMNACSVHRDIYARFALTARKKE